MKVAGFGFRSAATVASLTNALQAAGGPNNLTALAAPQDKAIAQPLLALAAQLGLPVLALSPANLAEIETVTHSARVEATRGTGSVAEASALAGAGVGARLVSTRQISHDRLATCAIATTMGEHK